MTKISTFYTSSRLAKKFTKDLITYIGLQGHTMKDERLDRTVRYVNDMSYKVRQKDVITLSEVKPLSKYRADWKRMKDSFNAAVKTAKKDPTSRRLMVVNTDDYLEIFHCFQSVSFVLNPNNKWLVIVYQRSADAVKLIEDLVFFSVIAAKFSKKTKLNIDEMVIHYNNIHFDMNGFGTLPILPK